MSVRINIRLPDYVHTACQVYVQEKGISLTDMIIDGLNLQTCTYTGNPVHTKKKPKKVVIVDMPVAAISVPVAPGEAKKPYKEPAFDIPMLRAKIKAASPLGLCMGCRSYNRDCTCPS